MNGLRIREKNIIHTEIKKLNGYIAHAERCISVTDDLTVIDKINQGIVEKREKITILEKRVIDVEKGELDEELERNVLTNLDEVNKKSLATIQRKSKIQDDKKIREAKAKESLDGIIASGRENKYAEKNYNYTLGYYDKICNQIPDYLLKDLNEKPNNRGFIWRGVQLYGQKQPIDDPTEIELVERISKDILNIHIWNKFVYEIYSKKHGELPSRIYHFERKKKFKDDGITFSRR